MLNTCPIAGWTIPGLRVRDLHLSPRHCIARGGAIIPAEVLVDGVGVTQVAWAEVEYFRLELDEHDLVWAEGLPAESYMYAGLRGDLHRDYRGGDGLAGEAAALTLHPVFDSYVPEEDTCLPLAVAGPAVQAARAELRAARADVGSLRRLGAGLGVRFKRQ